MAFVPLANALLVFQFSLLMLFCSSAPVYGDETLSYPPAEAPHPPHHRHHHPKPARSHAPSPPPSHPPVNPPPTPPPAHVKPAPSTPPAKPPAHPPVKPPNHPPVKPPTYPPPPRKMVAVQGVVYCKPCKYRGIDTLMGADPLQGAVVKLQCNNTKHGLVEQVKTDKNGYFFFMPQKLTTSGSHTCKVFLASSPLPRCNVTTNLHNGFAGAVLTHSPMPPTNNPPSKPLPFELFTVGPFAFEANKKMPCHY